MQTSGLPKRPLHAAGDPPAAGERAHHLFQHRAARGVLHSGKPSRGGAVHPEHGEPPPGNRPRHQGGQAVYIIIHGERAVIL
jgi:hypothetical protein